MKITKLSAAILAGSLLFSGITLSIQPSKAQVIQSIGDGKIDWSKGSITVTGSGAAPNKADMSAGQKRLLAQRAATADAYRQLAELINGVNVDSETIVKDFVTESDIIRTRVSALIKGAVPGKPKYMSDGTVEVEVTLGLYGQKSLSAVIVPPALEKNEVETIQPTPEPVSTPLPENPPTGSYTGVIIDCRGMGVEPAMSPQIVDANGKEIYIAPGSPIDPDLVVNIGIVGYADTLNQAQANSRVGKNPLIIKASKAGGKFKTDAVVSAADGQKIKQADSSANFLSRSKVIFVVSK